MENKISIIVPCYKVTDFLPQCVESLMNQTYKDIEIILVDDGSPDATGKLCDDYAKKDNRIKVVHKQNGGLVSARNAGYDVATGDWMMYVDGELLYREIHITSAVLHTCLTLSHPNYLQSIPDILPG